MPFRAFRRPEHWCSGFRPAPIFFSVALLCASAGCNSISGPLGSEDARETQLAKQAELQQLAEKLLGSGARVAISGNLAHNGHQQVIVMDPLSSSSADAPTGAAVRRAAVAERQGSKWVELLRCDEYLKNPGGFLRGTPLQPVTGWQARWNQAAVDSSLYFTPLAADGSAAGKTVLIRWNPAAHRYQSMDGNPPHFLDEMITLETPAAVLK